MRILFSSTLAFGHLLPMLPLAAAAGRAGHETALLTHPSMGDTAPMMRLLAAGPTVPEALADVQRRVGIDATAVFFRGVVEFFVESRLRLGAADALARARDFGPDLIVADLVDFLGPLAAADLDVPWAVHGASLPLAEPLASMVEEAAAARFADYDATRTEPVAYIDPWPDSLLRPADIYPAKRIPARPEPHSDGRESWTRPRFAGREGQPLVLVTLGTVVEDPAALAAVLASLARLDVNVIAAPHPTAQLDAQEMSTDGVHLAGFVPMRLLLDEVDVMVSAGGAGTVLSALSAGRPMVLLPMGLDKPVNAERVAAAGAAQVVATPAEVGAAVAKVLADPSFATGSARVAGEIAAMNSADEVLDLLMHI